MKPKLTLIAAMDENRLLANEHGIPWHLPRDVAQFREYTKDKWLLLGRRTFEEMRGWFREGHAPLVLTRQRDYVPDIGRTVATIEEALTLAAQAGQTELICCGGAQVYATALLHADRLVLTLVQDSFPPGTSPLYFPEWSSDEWNMISDILYPADAANTTAMRLTVLSRSQAHSLLFPAA